MNTENSQETASKALNATFLVWKNIKAKYTDAIILIRKDNDYFTFGSDAETVSVIMGVELREDTVLTSVCHLPHYRTDKLLHHLVKAGCRLALCDPLPTSG